MLHKIQKLLSRPNTTAQETRFDITQFASSEETNRFIGQANIIHRNLNEFLKCDAKDSYFVSLGENCSSAWYLKQMGLKKESYPFDWIFSTPEIVLDCINDGFCKFMDKSLIQPKDNGLSAGHLYYHSNLFNHRNPLNSQEDYDYYQRCCDRFMKVIKTEQNVIYVITLINEPDKRVTWANGFTQRFAMPREQNYKTVENLINCLREYNRNSQFIIVDHYTNQTRNIIFENMDESTFLINFSAGGDSTGVYYTNALDDFCFKLIMAGLCKKNIIKSE